MWTVLDAVAELELASIYADYRDDGRGRPAYEPSMMVALLLYAYARGNRSSRGIERACVKDIAYRVVTGSLAPDRSTIAVSDANRDFGEIAREILAEAAGIDEREDELYGSARGDELPEQAAHPRGSAPGAARDQATPRPRTRADVRDAA